MAHQTDSGKAMAGLREIPEAKRKSLHKREESLLKGVRLFEETNPQVGKSTDALHLSSSLDPVTMTLDASTIEKKIRPHIAVSGMETVSDLVYYF